jgi:RNA polymerase sigma factor (sigma-70 family)
VFRIACFMSRNSADAAEITQEAFCKVYSDFHQFRGDASFDTWIYRIVSNIAVDRARRSRRLLVLESLFWSCGESRSPSAEQELLLSELGDPGAGRRPPTIRCAALLNHTLPTGADVLFLTI